MTKSVLVTGGSGFIGRNLIEKLGSSYEIAAPRHSELDLLKPDSVANYLDRGKFDIVLHCATWDATAVSNKDPNRILDANLKMFFNIARCRGAFGRLLYYGSGAEYAKDSMPQRVTEDDFGNRIPRDDYGVSKYLMQIYAAGQPDIYNLRIFGVFGPYEDWRIRFISNVLCKALYDLPLTIRQNVKFDYLDVADLVELTRWFMAGQPHHHDYNVCAGRTYELTELAKLALDVSGKDLGITISKPGLAIEYSGDNSRLMREMGGFAFTPMSASMEALYTWYTKHKDRIDFDVLERSR